MHLKVSILEGLFSRIFRDLLLLSVVGNVYIADTNNNRIRKVTVSTGIISTIAGTGTYGYSGDGGQATSAAIKYPYGVALDVSSGGFQSILNLLVVFIIPFIT